jgi:hypothetical protein
LDGVGIGDFGNFVVHRGFFADDFTVEPSDCVNVNFRDIWRVLFLKISLK